MDEIFYVQLENAKELRKSSLEATKLVIQTLQSLERLKKIRNEKTSQMSRLASLMGEVNKICDEIRISPPAIDIQTIPVKKQGKKKPMSKPSPETTQLEEAISQIEQKLKGLG